MPALAAPYEPEEIEYLDPDPGKVKLRYTPSGNLFIINEFHGPVTVTLSLSQYAGVHTTRDLREPIIVPARSEQFVDNLQKDIEQDTGIRFGVVHDHEFAGIPVTQEGGVVSPLGFEASKALWCHLQAQGYINDKGKVQDTLTGR